MLHTWNPLFSVIICSFFCFVYSKITEYEEIRKNDNEGNEEKRTACNEDAEDAFSNEHKGVTQIILRDDCHVAKATEDDSKERILGNEIAIKEGEMERMEEEDEKENNSCQQQAERDCSETLHQNGKSHDVTLNDVRCKDINPSDAIFVEEIEEEGDSFRTFFTWNQQKGN